MKKDDIIDSCKIRLLCLGFNVNNISHFDTFIAYSVNKTENYIKNYCNIKTIPNDLYDLWVDNACGELLDKLKNSNLLNSENYNLDTAVKSITEGDVKVEYSINDGSLTDEQRLENVIKSLKDIDESSLIKYRRLVW